MNLVTGRKIFLLLTSVLFVLFFQSISHAHHPDDDVGTSLSLTNSYQTGNLGFVQEQPSLDPLDEHGGWVLIGSEEQEPFKSIFSYQDTNDVWKINASRGDKITVDIIVENRENTEFGNYDQPIPFSMELFDSKYTEINEEETPIQMNISTIHSDQEGYIPESKINWSDESLESGGDISTNEKNAHWRLVFTADKTGLFYLNVKGDYFDDPNFIDTYPSGIPYKIRATVAKPKLLTAYQTQGRLSNYPPAEGFYTPTDYYSLNLKAGDDVTLTLKSTSSSSDLLAQMTVFNKYWGSPSGLTTSQTASARYVSQGQVTFKSPSLQTIFIKIERLDETQGPYTLIATVKRKSSMTVIGPSIINYPNKARISGAIVLDSGVKAGVPVQIFRKPIGGTWARVATVKTNSLGKYTYLASAPKHTYFYAKWAGDPLSIGAIRYLGSKSPTKYVKVTPSLSITVSATSLKLGYTISIKGRMLPAAGHSGKLINIQVQTSTGAWSRVGSAKLSSTGYYSFYWKPVAKGSYRLRTYFAGDTDHLQKASLTKTIKVY